MPIIRYQLRNEYGLGDPELYRTADREDPEALLEGVAMAGLVGVLRQLGDLAEFAAEIFHDLHEEVMATAARGHVLMLRVQQLEAEFPLIEKGFLSETTPSHLVNNAGIDWHPNLQIDQNLITREDMPRFILDSYEESRGPPRLFMLDKFDIAGDGACLKRYSDPSFFKMDFASSGKMEPDIQREKKSRKNKKKMQRGRNGETPGSYIIPHVNPKLEHVAPEKASGNPPAKRVKLKTRQLNDNTSIGRSYMEYILENHSSEHTGLSENLANCSHVKMKTIESTELAPEVRQVIMDSSNGKPSFRVRNQRETSDKEELSLAQKEVVSYKRDTQTIMNEKKELLQKATGEVEKLLPTFQKELLVDTDSKREGNDDAESRTNGSLDGYRSDDVASELDSYLDALTTMDSEIETDNETKAKLEPSFFRKECNKLDSSMNEDRVLVNECLDSHMFRKSSTTQNSLTNKGMSSSPNGDISNCLADSIPSQGTSTVLLGMFMDPEPADESHYMNFENNLNNNVNCEALGNELSIDLVPKQMTPDILGTLTASDVESSSSCITGTTSALIHTRIRATPEDVQSDTAKQNITPSTTDSTEMIGISFGGESSPPVISDVQETDEDLSVTLPHPVEGHKSIDNLLEGDSHQRSEESKVPSAVGDDSVSPVLISKDTEILSDTLLHLGNEPDLNLQIQEDPSLEMQVAVSCTEETTAEAIMSVSTVSSLPQKHEATDLEITPSIYVEDSPLPLSVCDEKLLHRSVCQDPKVDSGESTLSRKCPPISPLDNSPSTPASDGLLEPADNFVSFGEKIECAKSSTSSEDTADVAENESTCLNNMGSFAENEAMVPGISSPGTFVDVKMPQESCSLEYVESTSKVELPDLMKVLPHACDYETRGSVLLTGDNLNLLNDTVPFNSPVELVTAERHSPCLVTECIESDKLDFATIDSPKSSFRNTNLQEGTSDSVSEQQKLDATGTSSLKDLIDLDVQLVLGTDASEEDYAVVTNPQDSETARLTLDLCSQTVSGERNYDCHTESFEPAQEDLHPVVDNKTAIISSVEVGGGNLVNSILQNESEPIYSGIEHYLGKTMTTNSEDQTGVDDRQVSNVASLQQEEDDAICIPAGSKSADPVHGSFDHMDVTPVTSVPCQEDSKPALSPQSSRTEERVLESSDTFDFESVKHAEDNMHPLEANEVIMSPLENQVTDSKALPSTEPCQTANKDLFLPNDVSTESISPLIEAFALQSSNGSDEISLQQKFDSLKLSHSQFERRQSLAQDDNSVKTESQPPGPKAVSSHKIYELEIISTNVSSYNQLETEVDSPLQSSYWISESSAVSNASLASLETFPRVGASSSTMSQQQSSELPLDEDPPLDDDPPLPPLPPLQWRMGKLRPSSLMSNGEMTRPQNGTIHLTALPSLDHSGGSLVVMGGAGVDVHPPNPFLQVHVLSDDSNQFGYQTLEEESVNLFESSALPPVVEGEKSQDNILSLDVQMNNLPANSSSVVSHVEDKQQNHESHQEALSGEVPQSSNPFISPPTLSDMRSQYFPAVSEGEPFEPPKSSLPTLAYTESPHRTESLDTAIMHPFNPFLTSTSPDVENYGYSSGTFGDRMVNLDFPDPLLMTETASQGLLLSEGENFQASESETLPTAEYVKPNGRPSSLLNRPRDPLIEAVASHDKSTLRRVSELVRPSARPDGERNTLLEQIKNKSFSLKPAAVAKPSIKGPPTNLKVAAILEKANAIRQAFAGSDEDDDGDTWSDS
uniref:Protein SCAR n=1 Tax=Anthurium amnicola TaxID=1678845 RepID=A0A1D1XYI4_9ARAE